MKRERIWKLALLFSRSEGWMRSKIVQKDLVDGNGAHGKHFGLSVLEKLLEVREAGAHDLCHERIAGQLRGQVLITGANERIRTCGLKLVSDTLGFSRNVVLHLLDNDRRHHDLDLP